MKQPKKLSKILLKAYLPLIYYVIIIKIKKHMEDKYPYLGINQIDNKNYVVLFTEEDTGVVVMNETNSEVIKFGKITNFDESKFKPLPQGQCVRLSN